MVQNKPNPRGRPRSYDPDTAIERATSAFWRGGFAATSLDDLTAETAMNRPSLYAAFGDKQALYVKTLERYRDDTLTALAEVFAEGRPLPVALRVMYRAALDIYRAGQPTARGCYLIGTAAAAAVDDPAVRAVLGGSLRDFEAVFVDAFERGALRGEVASHAEPAVLAAIASSVLHSIAVRSRAGEPRAALERLADSTIALVCAAAPPARARPGAGKR